MALVLLSLIFLFWFIISPLALYSYRSYLVYIARGSCNYQLRLRCWPIRAQYSGHVICIDQSEIRQLWLSSIFSRCNSIKGSCDTTDRGDTNFALDASWSEATAIICPAIIMTSRLVAPSCDWSKVWEAVHSFSSTPRLPLPAPDDSDQDRRGHGHQAGAQLAQTRPVKH